MGLMLEMKPPSEEGKAHLSRVRTTRTKRVHFAPLVSQITFPLHEDAPFVETMWYAKGETQQRARDDISFMTSQFKEKSQASVCSEIHGGIQKKIQEDETGSCCRGLEMHMPGQLGPRQSRRRAYQEALLRKQELLSTLYAGDRDEAAERLQKFLILKSKACREEARALAVQDAIDAQHIYHHGTTSASDHLVSDKSSSNATTTPLTTLRLHPQATMLRAA